MPSLSQLKYIIAVHRFGHFGKAARACNISQPTLSAQVQKAEEELGLKIFLRDTKPVAATERGAALIEQAQVVLAAHERLLRLAKGQFRELAGELSIAVIPTLAPYVLPWFLPVFAKKHPLLQVSIFERTTDEIVAALKRQTLDVGLLVTPLDDRRLKERRLFLDPLYLYAAPGESLLENDEVEISALEPDKMWILEEAHCMRAQMLAVCEATPGRTTLATVRFEGGSFETLRNTIDVAGGYTVIPETFARQLPPDRRKKQVRPFAGAPLTREVSLVHLKSTWKADILDRLEYVIAAAVPRPFRSVPEDAVVVPMSGR